MKIRAYTSADCPQLAALFYETVHTVNAKDYPPEQLDVWATGQVDLAQWDRSLRAHHSLVAEEDGVTVGFADMDADGYLDRLYVHKDYQGRGVAAAQANKKAESPVFRRWPGGGAFRCVSAVSHGRAAGGTRAARRRKRICYDFARFSLSA